MSLSAYAPCFLCPRQCGADRLAGKTGVCGETAQLRIASHGPHMGEEPPFTGTRGSGTIFFCGCSTHCFFCQNWQISNVGSPGRTLTADDFHGIAIRLIRLGVHNLNFVTPDHFWPHIRALAVRLRAENHTIPFLFNSSGYHLPAMIPQYAEHMAIFMPDFKFSDPDLARDVIRDERYPALALESLRLMVAAKGFLAPFDPAGREPARQGVLVRHLVLPGQVQNTLDLLTLLREEFGARLPLSLMSQYSPVPATRNRPPFHRHLTAGEYQTALDHAQRLGFQNLLIQPLSIHSDFLPDFNQPNPFKGNP